MKVVIAGSREFTDTEKVYEIIRLSGLPITEVVTGMARGVDRIAEQFGYDQDLDIQRFYPDWSMGKYAGKLRNTEMADYADAGIVIWLNGSNGTKDMIEKLRQRNKPLFLATNLNNEWCYSRENWFSK